jgi:hypothetical protein
MHPSAPDRRLGARVAVHSPSEALDALTALATFDRPQILVLLLDADHRGSTCLAVDDAREADCILRVGSLLAELAGHDIGLVAVVLASVRPARGAELADVDRWEAVDARLDAASVSLLEWFVLGEHSAVGIGELVGAPWRWRCPDPGASP